MRRSLPLAPSVMKRRARLVVCLCAVLLLGGLATTAPLRVGAAPPAGAPVQTRWEDLVPKEWDPTKRFRDLKLDMLNDSDPRVLQLMRDMRATWDNAPTNNRLDGTTVRLPGYVVPLDEVKGDIKEFLLVPYFGACIHTPPPPANQIVHVVADKPLKGLRMMDAVWVSGTLRTQRQDSVMGMSGYAIQGGAIERYIPPSRP
jgi:uncharacterized protein